LRIGGTCLGLTYVLLVADLDALVDVLMSIPAYVPAGVIAVYFVGTMIGAVRWKVVLWAYGADRSPTLLRLTYLYLIGLFYNTYLPGGVGGDVIRGLVSRESFGESGVTRSLTVVFVERVLGLAGLLIVAAGVLLVHPLPELSNTTEIGVIGLLGALATIVGIAMGRRFAVHAPTVIGRVLAGLPPLAKPTGLAAGLGLSLCTQVSTAVAGYLVLSTVEPSVGFLDALVIVPVAAAAAFFPLTVGGAGAREAAFVFLCSAALSMDAADAAATSLVLFACLLVAAGLGGLLSLAVPLDRA